MHCPNDNVEIPMQEDRHGIGVYPQCPACEVTWEYDGYSGYYHGDDGASEPISEQTEDGDGRDSYFCPQCRSVCDACRTRCCSPAQERWSKAERTPYPPKSQHRACPNPIAIKDQYGNTIAFTACGYPASDEEQTARLIAAAPALLEALEWVAEDLRAGVPRDETATVVRAAIKAARGA